MVLPFQQWYREFLAARQLSNREAATKLGVATTTTHGYKHGIFTPSPDVQERLAALADVPVETISRLIWMQEKQRQRNRIAGIEYSTAVASRRGRRRAA